MAITRTISKFGPSGSSRDTSTVLEQMMDVMPNIKSETFFDLKYIQLYYLQSVLFENLF